MTLMLLSAPCTPQRCCAHMDSSLRAHRLSSFPAALRPHTHVGAQYRRPQRFSARAAAVQQANVRMPTWEIMHRQLTTEHRLESVSPTDAENLVKSGKFVLVDVRPPDVFQGAHPEGAQSAPLFQSVNWGKPDFKKYLRAVAFMANGVKPVEENTEFLEDVEKAANGKGVILMCEAGGTTKPSPNFAAGKASRSLKAAWKVVTASDIPVKHLAGGVYGWYSADLPMFGKYDKSNVGRTPNAAVEPKGQYYEEAQKALEQKRQQEEAK